MEQLFDYLDWRGDLTIDASPLNQVDHGILSALVYAHFEAIAPEDYGKTLAQLLAKYGDAVHQPDNTEFRKNHNLLWDRLAGYPRFADVRLANFAARTNETDAEGPDVQFGAATFIFPRKKADGTDAEPVVVVSFRGTDTSIAGWREDVAMGHEEEVPAQRYAVDYLDVETSRYPLVQVNGHSKGGNLALYAAAFCSRQGAVGDIWNFDGPGLTDVALATTGWRRVEGRVHTLVPESSVFGMIMGTGQPREVINAEGVGFAQHSIFNWEVRGTVFVQGAELSAYSKAMSRGLADYLGSTSVEERRFFADALFKLVDSGDVPRSGDLLPNLVKALPSIRKNGGLYTEEEKAALKTFVGTLAKGGVDGLGLPEISLPDITLPEIPLLEKLKAGIRKDEAAEAADETAEAADIPEATEAAAGKGPEVPAADGKPRE